MRDQLVVWSRILLPTYSTRWNPFVISPERSLAAEPLKAATAVDFVREHQAAARRYGTGVEFRALPVGETP